MSKKQMRKKLQGRHVNSYAGFSKAEEPIKLFDFDKEGEKCDYFKAVIYFLNGISVESNNENSSIEKLWYFKKK
jgi:hypothetical protein